MKNKLFSKVKRRIFDQLRKFIKYNYHLKPTGIYNTSREFINSTQFKGSIYKEIYPDLGTILPVPEGLFKALSPYGTYDAASHNNSNTLIAKNNYAVISIPHGRLYTNNIDFIAVISPDNRLIADVSFQYNTNRVTLPYENKIFELSYFDKPVKYPGVAFSMLAGGGATYNYGHWFVDSFSRLHLLKESGMFDQVDWFIVPSYKYDYHIDSLKMMGIEPEKIVVGHNHMHIQADVLITTTHPRGMRNIMVPDWLPLFYRNTFVQESNRNSDSPRYIYISRKDSNLRKITNEDQLIEVLSEYGFESFELSNLSFAEKVDLFASADIIISAMGAGLFNIAFSKKGTKLIEIFSESFVQHLYYSIAHSAGVQYDYIICKSNKKAQTMDEGLVDDLTVDIQELKLSLERFLTTDKASVKK